MNFVRVVVQPGSEDMNFRSNIDLVGDLTRGMGVKHDPSPKPDVTDWRTMSVTEIAAENKGVREYIAQLEGQVVSRFDEEQPTTFQQGVPTHELQGIVTAEDCTFFVSEIVRLREKVEELEGELKARGERQS